MARFRYRAYGRDGALAEGQVEAASEETARELLWARGLMPFEMRGADQDAVPWWRREVFARPGLTPPERAAFIRAFATLATAGLPLDDALRVLGEQATSAKARQLAGALLAAVLGGAPLSEAMETHPHTFGADTVSIIRAGEAGGTLSQVLQDHATLLEARLALAGRLRSALLYPAILIVLSLGSLAVIIGVLVPSIAPLLREGSGSVPAAVRVMMAVHDHWQAMALALVGTVLAVMVVSSAALRRPTGRLAFDQIKLTVPLLGPLLLTQETARFARTAGALLKAGVPLLQAAGAARAVVANRAVAAALAQAIEAVREGASLHQALGDHTMLPALALRMIAVGEEAGTLGAMLERVAALYEEGNARAIDRFMTVLTPTLTVLIAGLVGGLILTVMNVILSLNDLAVR